MLAFAVNVSEPDDFDVETTKSLLKQYDLKAAGSLVRLSLPSQYRLAVLHCLLSNKTTISGSNQGHRCFKSRQHHSQCRQGSVEEVSEGRICFSYVCARIPEHASAEPHGAVQILHECNGKYFVGVNFCAMDKYREPCSPEQWKCCVESIKAGFCLSSS